MADRTERRLAAIMFTDIVGSTAVTARSEPAGLALRDHHRNLVRTQVDRYHGRFIEAPGDECLATFESALDSVNCALAMQQALEDAPDPDLQVRIGIHLGETVFRGDEVFGDGVNIAARIIALAEPAEIYVSTEVADALRNQPNLELSSRGEHQLKNVGRPVAVFLVQGTPGAPSLAKRRPDTGDGKDIRSLAVLPLENLSGDPEQEYFADGMTEAVISEFARIGSISVISRTSVMQYKQARKPLPEIAQELGVDGIVEGTVMRAGDRVRITVQLIDARSDHHLWADNYDRDLTDILALQSDVARAVAQQIRVELAPEVEEVLTTTRRVDPRAYDAYLRGLKLAAAPAFSREYVSKWQAALERLERAVELDPGLAEAWSRLARVRVGLAAVSLDLRQRREFPRARDAAERALELDGRLGAAHAVLGMVRLNQDWDFEGSRRAHERATKLSPNDPFVLSNYAWYLLMMGKTEEALGVSEQMVKVAPLTIGVRADRLSHHFMARDYESALEEADRIRALNPAFASGYIAHTYWMLDRSEESYREWIRGAPNDAMRVAIQNAWAEGGMDAIARGFVDYTAETEGAAPRERAIYLTYAGEKEQAFAWLERAFRERDPLMVALKMDPRFDPLRSDPRWDDLMRRIGFPES